ncbi:hypothetical protein LA66_00010 [Aureimonas altamirensis]|uniref:DUF2382 domain-containing protein n=1 Tax=Aureimonas altamirensis TaxID=370622 RepID=A0A0B1Q400_9HYPH|nr:DUF2382 domain-containing protein [Aureimonas altamirensis]KHJ55114.1 hypothetical protein LA66_00010 [Aureimonas altamirensis]
MAEVEIIPILEEQTDVSKRTVCRGTVRVETSTNIVEEIASSNLESTDVEVVRVPIGREIDEAPQVRTEGETTIVPVLEEVLVVHKRLILKEELHITRRVTTEQVDVPVPLRKQTVTVTRSDD